MRLRNWSAMWLAVQCTIQVECGTDQGQMREGLRKVSERFAASPYLFGIEPQMIGVAQHLFEQQPGFRQLRDRCVLPGSALRRARTNTC